MSVGFYCLSYNGYGKISMQNIFNKMGIEATFYSGVSFNDRRLHKLEEGLKRIWSTCYGHLDMIRTFYESDKEYGIFCEDDIIIRNDFIKNLPDIIADFNKLDLDILMLGYLCENKIDEYSNFPTLLVKEPFKYLHYPDDLWGTQMYMISKAQALKILSKYYYGYAEKTLIDRSLTPFSADWTITKEGKRALIYPLIAIENFNKIYDDEHQTRAHRNCYKFSYTPELFD
jgi:GR25 family glycosyltransferase involved in LPS biosynthesis